MTMKEKGWQNSVRAKLPAVRTRFPSALKDDIMDGYFINTVSRSIDAVESRKVPEKLYIGEWKPLDVARAARTRFPREMSTTEDVVQGMASKLEGTCAPSLPVAALYAPV